MKTSGDAAKGRHAQTRVLGSVIVTVVALVVIVVGLLGLHSAGADQAMASTTTASAHAHVGHGAVAATPTAPRAVTAVTVPLGDGTPVCDQRCMVDCALMGVTCAILFILASMILLAGRPSLYGRLLDANGRAVPLAIRSPRHIYRPSLIALSISRT